MSVGAGTIAVVDAGKTAGKVVVCDRAGRPLAARTFATAARPGPPYPYIDVDAFLAAALDGLRALGREHPIRFIVPVAHGAAAALHAGAGADGELALPVLDYELGGPDGPDGFASAADYYAPSFAETGSPAMSGGLNLGRQLHFLERSFPDAFARATAVIPYAQHLAFRLSGRLVSGQPGPWSRVATFERGLSGSGDAAAGGFQARWIGRSPEPITSTVAGAPLSLAGARDVWCGRLPDGKPISRCQFRRWVDLPEGAAIKAADVIAGGPDTAVVHAFVNAREVGRTHGGRFLLMDGEWQADPGRNLLAIYAEARPGAHEPRVRARFRLEAEGGAAAHYHPTSAPP